MEPNGDTIAVTGPAAAENGREGKVSATDPSTLDRRAAARIIQSLADSGQPPKLGARFINVGTQPLLDRLRGDYLELHLLAEKGQDGGGVCKWIEADYGNGKTQFLRCVQELAWDLNYVTAFVELSQDECPLDRPDRVYASVARSVAASPRTPADVDLGRGIDNALRQLLDRMFPNVLTGVPDDNLQREARAWVEMTLGSTPVESTSFLQAASRYLLATLENDEEKARVCGTYLRGEPVPAAELKTLKIYEKLDKASGFRMLRSMCQLFQRSGMATGTVLLFDEARRSLSLMSSKSQKIACENLLSVINRCNSGELPGTLFLYAVMPEFFTTFAVTYPALQQRCSPATRINLNAIKNVDEQELLVGIGGRITELFRIANDTELDSKVTTANLELIAKAALRETMGTGTRRLLVKTWVAALQQARDADQRKLDDQDVEELMKGMRQELDTFDTAAVTAVGE